MKKHIFVIQSLTLMALLTFVLVSPAQEPDQGAPPRKPDPMQGADKDKPQVEKDKPEAEKEKPEPRQPDRPPPMEEKPRKISPKEADAILSVPTKTMIVAYQPPKSDDDTESKKKALQALLKEKLVPVVHIRLVHAFEVNVPDVKTDEMIQILERLHADSSISEITPNAQTRLDCHRPPVQIQPATVAYPIIAPPAVPCGPSGCNPNDPLRTHQYALDSIRAPKAWCSIRTTAVPVAVIDSGIDLNHEDLKPNLLEDPFAKQKEFRFGVGFYSVESEQGKVTRYYDIDTKGGTYDPIPIIGPSDFRLAANGTEIEGAGHGTHVAGIIAAVGNNEIGTTGVSWNAKIIPVRAANIVRQADPKTGQLVKDKAGKQLFRMNFSTVNQILAVDYAVQRGAKVINMSFGTAPGFASMTGIEARMYRELERRGILVVIAAGNDNNDNDKLAVSPANSPFRNVLVVASIDQNENKATSSNYGKNTVHIAAPGDNILSTFFNNSTKTLGGTSMAAPCVAGAAALLWGHPKWSSMDAMGIKAQLMDNARPIPSMKDQVRSGGTLDLSFICKECTWPPETATPSAVIPVESHPTVIAEPCLPIQTVEQPVRVVPNRFHFFRR